MVGGDEEERSDGVDVDGHSEHKLPSGQISQLEQGTVVALNKGQFVLVTMNAWEIPT